MTNKKNKKAPPGFEGVEICILPGDIVHSKKGMLWKGAISGQYYLVYSAEYRGDGKWLARKKVQIK